MKKSVYIKNYLINDLILLATILGITYLVFDSWNKNDSKEEASVELIPLKISENDEISQFFSKSNFMDKCSKTSYYSIS